MFADDFVEQMHTRPFQPIGAHGDGNGQTLQRQVDVQELIGLIDRNVQRSALNEHILKSARSNRYQGSIFYLMLGVIFCGIAIYNLVASGIFELVIYLGLTGGCFLIFGSIAFWKAMSFPKEK